MAGYPPPNPYANPMNPGQPPAPGYPSTQAPGCPPATGPGYPPAPGAGYPPVPGAGYTPVPGAGYPPVPGAGYTPVPGAGYTPVPGAGYTPAPAPGYPGFGQPPQPGYPGIPGQPPLDMNTAIAGMASMGSMMGNMLGGMTAAAMNAPMYTGANQGMEPGGVAVQQPTGDEDNQDSGVSPSSRRPMYIKDEAELVSRCRVKILSLLNDKTLRMTASGEVDCLGDPHAYDTKTMFIVDRHGDDDVTLYNVCGRKYLSVSKENKEICGSREVNEDCHLNLSTSLGKISIGNTGFASPSIFVEDSGAVTATPFKLKEGAKFKVGIIQRA